MGRGRGPLTYVAVVHPSARFVYKLDLDSSLSTLNVFPFDSSTGASAPVQQITFSGNRVRFMSGDGLGRFLFVQDQGVRVFSIDQNSGKLAEVPGSPSFNGDTAINGFFSDPSGHFLLVVRGNSFQVVAIDAASGKLTPAAAPVSVSGQEIGRIAFATF